MIFENTQRIAGRYGRSMVRDPNDRPLDLAPYASQLPDPEPAFSNLDILQDRVASTNNKVLFPPDGNDKYGCCTISGLAHLITLLYAMTGVVVIPTTKEVVDLYFHLSGGRDDGLNLSDVLNWWMKNKFAGVQLVASAQIDPANWNLIKQAIQFFGHVYIGFNTTSNVISDFNKAIPWNGGTLDGQGHCVVVYGYTADGGGSCFTWGNIQPFTQKWWKECVNEVRVALTPQNAIFTNETMANLTADLAALDAGGSGPQFR